MTNSYAKIINSQIEAFPPLPTTVTKVLTVTSNPKSSANDLMRAILPDQTMCTAILKVANSAFFGIPREVASIERAVVVLGYDEIRNIVIGKAVFGSIRNLSKETRNTLESFWEHAYLCGLASKIIGEHLRISPSELFVAGLIHDIGKIAMLLAYPDKYTPLRDIIKTGHNYYPGEERISFGISHDEAGLQLARKWLLPEKLMMGIGFHHFPQGASSCIEYPLIVHAADILALLLHQGEGALDVYIEENFTKLFSPEIIALWQKNNLPLEPQKLTLWLEELQCQREKEQNILSIFLS